MSDFIAYHSVERMGCDYQPTEQFHFFSSKPESFLRSSLGSRVWVIVGTRDGARTSYRLAGMFTPTEIQPEADGYGILGTGTPFRPAFDVTALPWFAELLREQNKFSFGFNRIRGGSIVTEMQRFLHESQHTTYPFCVYTIVSRDVLDTVAMERRPLIQTERKTWAKAKAYLKEASSEGSRVPVILGDAKDCSRLLYWGLLMRVEIQQSSTEYEVDRLRPLRDGHTPQELVLASSGENIAPGFIRPYALCHTPTFLIESTALAFVSPEEGESPETYLEGASIRVSVNAYERNSKARQKCIEHYGCACAACGFDFEGTYGVIGRGFIHVHHVKPLSEVGAQYEVNPIQDLRPVCPNCHAMLHTQSPAMSIDDLKALLKQ